jgi:hypothetical protein
MDNSITQPQSTFKDALQRLAQMITAQRVAWAIIVFGVALRAALYLFKTALYVDEGALALNIINRSFAGLLQPLDSEQAAPVGFLFLEKLAFLTFGDGEYALRLFPFLFSIAALFLFYAAARRCLQAWGATIALAFFAVSSYVIYFAAQIKQYSSDIAVTLLILIIGFDSETKELTGRRAAVFATVGAIVVWLSHPSVFILAGVGATLAFSALLKKDWPRVGKLALVIAIWLMSFAAFYLVSVRTLSGNETLEKSWAKKGTFMPLPPHSLDDLKWIPTALVKMFSNPLGLPFPLVAALVFLIGGIALFLKNKQQLFMLIAPIALTMLASGVHKYPFGRRLLLFLLPAVLLVVAAGAQYISDKKRPYSIFIGLALVALLLIQPVGGATNNMLHPHSREDIRPIMAYVRDHQQPGDVIYVYHHQRESFQYYARKYGFDASQYVLGIDARDKTKSRNDWQAYERDLDQFRGRGRVWLMFTHVRRIQDKREDEFMVQYMGKLGVKLDEFIPGETSSVSAAEEAEQADNDEFTPAPASVYLFDLSKAPSPGQSN